MISRSVVAKYIKEYEDGTNTLSDAEFDVILEQWQKENPGEDIPKTKDGRRVPLDYWLGSQNKVHTQKQLDRWSMKHQGPYYVQMKYDGISAVYTGDKLFTRGDGRNGLDISRLIPVMKLPPTNGLVIRGEIIIPNSLFISKYSGSFAIARNMIAGCCNSLELSGPEVDFRFRPFEIMNERLTVSEEYNKIKQLGFEAIIHIIQHELVEETLATFYDKLRKGKYDIDGLVISSSLPRLANDGKNPERSCAFKVKDDPIRTIVTDIEWNPSRQNLLKPTIIFDTIVIDGANVTRATGHNASIVMLRGIGIGAEIGVIRSGGTIPYISDVYTMSEDFGIPYEYKWCSDVDIKSIEETTESKIKRLSYQFELLGIEKIRTAKCTGLVEAGVMDIVDVLKYYDYVMEHSLLKLEQLDSIASKLSNIELHKLMNISLFFPSFSTILLKKFTDEFPDLFDLRTIGKEEWIVGINCIDGFSDIRAEKLYDGLESFFDWCDENCGFLTITKPKLTGSDLAGMIACFTGFRDGCLSEKILARGGTVSASVTKKTNILVIADNGSDTTSKVTKAVSNGVQVVRKSEFKAKYSL